MLSDVRFVDSQATRSRAWWNPCGHNRTKNVTNHVAMTTNMMGKIICHDRGPHGIAGTEKVLYGHPEPS